MTVLHGPAVQDMRPTRVGWIHGVRTDVVLALGWVPFALGAIGVRGHATALHWFAWGVLVLSLLHQPVTLALAYGDGEQFAANKRVFTWAPIALAAAILVGLRIDFLLVAVIGGIWNTEHTLMQRYGITRIYRRKGGDIGSSRLDLAMLASWLVLVLAWAVASPRTAERIESLGLGTANERSLELLVDVRPAASVLLVVALAGALATTARWFDRERRFGFDANPAAYLYLASTAGLFVLAAFHPVAGLLAWVGSHAAEYFIIVGTNLNARYPADVAHRAPVGRAVRGPLGIVGFIALVSLVGAGVVALAGTVGTLATYGLVFFGLGGLHIICDGFIWKLRRPTVAAGFGLEG